MSCNLRFTKAMPALAAMLLLICQSSCEPTQPPAPSELPPAKPALSLGESARVIRQHADKIREAFESGDPVAAHDEMHEIGTLLTELPQLPEAAALGAPAQAELQVATESLLDAFTKLDGVLHGGEEVSWDDVAAAIDEGLAVLAPHAAPDDDGDGDDHDHDEHDSDHDHGEHAAHDDD